MANFAIGKSTSSKTIRLLDIKIIRITSKTRRHQNNNSSPAIFASNLDEYKIDPAKNYGRGRIPPSPPFPLHRH